MRGDVLNIRQEKQQKVDENNALKMQIYEMETKVRFADAIQNKDKLFLNKMLRFQNCDLSVRFKTNDTVHQSFDIEVT